MGRSTNGRPITPWKGSWAYTLPEIARDIGLMHKNIREGYMPAESQQVIDALADRAKQLTGE